jgi:D-3-phosphoglycerate dehydrogenase
MLSMNNIRILATQPVDDYCREQLSRFGQVDISPDMKVDTLQRELTNVSALIVRGQAPITREVIAAAPMLRVIGRTGVGYDTIDIEAATERGIPVVYTPGVGARAVAEAAMAFMLALCKSIGYWDTELKAGHWGTRYTFQGRDLDGQTLGIIGLGRIGSLVARMAQPFEMRVIAYDPYIDPTIGQALGVEMMGLDEVLRQADFLTLHCPENDETRGFINRQRLEQLKQGAYLINLARGGVIESLTVVDDLLRSGHLRGAALDVFNDEPPDTSHPLFSNPQCLVSPHSMATTRGAMTRIFRSMTDDMTSILEGRSPQHVVNPQVLR